MRLELTYTTTYRYDPPTAGVTALRIRPKSHPGQRVEWSLLRVSPGRVTRSYVDAWDTAVDLVEAPVPHTESTFEVRAIVETDASEHTSLLRPDEAVMYRRDSNRVPLDAVRPLGWALPEMGQSWMAVESLLAWLPQRLVYQLGVSDAETPVAMVVERGAGVCQDFAQVMLAFLRTWGWAARYACGFVFTGENGDTSIEAEAMHAWVEVFRPGHGWIGLDPTTGRRTDDRYVVVAHGRDYDDVRPVRGVLMGASRQEQGARLMIGLAPRQAQQ